MIPKTRYIPSNAQEIKRDDLDVIVYLYFNSSTRPCAVGYIGERRKPDFLLYFLAHHGRTAEENRALYIDNWLNEQAKAQASRQASRAAKAQAHKEFKHCYKVGDILDSSWGYEQTNVYFYEVVAVPSDKSIVIREIGQDQSFSSDMSGTTMPEPGKFTGEPMTKRVNPDIGGIKVDGHYAGKWDGRAMYWSSYG